MTGRFNGLVVLAIGCTAALASCAGGGSAPLAPLAAAPGGQGAVASKLTIKRDTYGTPHVYADNTHDLFYGFGYAVAEDRLYQLEMAKRSGNGTVAAVLGPRYAATDIATRSGIDPASVRRQLDALSAEDRAMFDGYAKGVNARIREVLANKAELLPREFVDAGFEPGSWSSEDVALVWIGLILNRFFGGSAEVANLALLNQLKAEKGASAGQSIYDQMRWLEDPAAPTIIPRPGAVASARQGSEATGDARLALRPISQSGAASHRALQVATLGLAATENMPTASNAWVLGPSRSADGTAILYNGPQQGFNNPSFVTAIGLHGAGYDLTGMTPIGLLPVLFGTNGTIAWGSTVGSLDTNDTYQEQLNPANRYEYRFKGRFIPMEKRTESIKVKGEADRSFDVYSTVHGFVQTWDLANQTAYSAKRSWEGVEVETMLGWGKAAQARNWNQFMAQAARVSASITWFYADVDGNIGAAGLGALPVRPAQQNIQFPALGDGSMEWQGRRPFSENPKAYNPAQGYFVSWNNQIAAGLRADGANFSAVDRVNELGVQLAGPAKFTPEQAWSIAGNAAVADLNARYFVPYIKAATASLPASDPVRKAADALVAWDMRLQDTNKDGQYDGPGVTILQAWLKAMTVAVLKDDLPAGVFNSLVDLGYAPLAGGAPGSLQPARASKLLFNALQGASSGVPQRYDFLNGQTPDSVVRAALSTAVAELTSTYGADPAKWVTPSARHRFSKTNAIGVPWAAEDQETPLYQNRGTAGFRVVLRKDAIEMCSLMAPGQSGFVSASLGRTRHYDDQLPLFETNSCKQDAVGRAQVDARAKATRTLTVSP
ncbi:penicillin acylase family protein [Variovorax saccharolyticus]|uniref:penicillin acylase family protein n=1 Tax=Variovorax saccharolyticus TaxID=3053516 RepID=UPI002579189A|nr:penicillin acylase family protein [Variovorax sp. J31P216]MDM0026258.1 penicillin acylase family protein [Variovorax sp. J31P216]